MAHYKITFFSKIQYIEFVNKKKGLSFNIDSIY